MVAVLSSSQFVDWSHCEKPDGSENFHRLLEHNYIYGIAFRAKHAILSDSECGEKLIRF